MSDFQMTVTGLPGFVEGMQSAPGRLTTNLLSAANAAALYGQGIAQLHAPVGQMGYLKNSIQAVPAVPIAGGVQSMIGVGAEYGIVMELGRRPGAKMPPQGALLGWMGFKGIPPELEFVVRRGIARHGIKPHPFMQPAFEALNGGVAEKLFGDAIAKTLNEIGGGA